MHRCVGVGNDLKPGTLVVLDTMSQPTDFGFKRSRVRVRESSPIFISGDCTYLLVTHVINRYTIIQVSKIKES